MTLESTNFDVALFPFPFFQIRRKVTKNGHEWDLKNPLFLVHPDKAISLFDCFSNLLLYHFLLAVGRYRDTTLGHVINEGVFQRLVLDNLDVFLLGGGEILLLFR